MPATANATRLHYKITPTTVGGRFPAIPPNSVPDRIIEVTNPIAAATPEAAQEICLANPSTPQCPVDQNAATNALQLQQSLCNQQDAGALCLFSERIETPGWDRLSNFEGIVPVQPHPGTEVVYYLNYQSQEGTYADDYEYTLDRLVAIRKARRTPPATTGRWTTRRSSSPCRSTPPAPTSMIRLPWAPPRA